MTAERTPVPLPARRQRRPAPGPSDAAAVFGVRSTARPDDALRELEVAAIERNPRQPRRRFDPKPLQALAESIRHRGVLQPVLVRPVSGGRYELVAGERRWRAAQEAGLERIPAFVRDADDTLTLELGLIENIVREDLTPVEEARTLLTLIEDLGVSQRALAERIGRSQPDISNTIRLLDLPEAVLDLLDGGRLTKGHGKVLLSEADHGRRRDLAQRAAADGWSVRELERAVSGSGRRTGVVELVAVVGRRRRALLAPQRGVEECGLHLGDRHPAREDLGREVMVRLDDREAHRRPEQAGQGLA